MFWDGIRGRAFFIVLFGPSSHCVFTTSTASHSTELYKQALVRVVGHGLLVASRLAVLCVCVCLCDPGSLLPTVREVGAATDIHCLSCACQQLHLAGAREPNSFLGLPQGDTRTGAGQCNATSQTDHPCN
jgi:hypothetical protein